MTYQKHDIGEYWLIQGEGYEVLVSNGEIETVKENRGSSWYNIEFEDIPQEQREEIKKLI